MKQLTTLLGVLLLTICQVASSLETDFQTKFLNTPVIFSGPGSQSTEPGKLVSILSVDGLAAHIAESSGDTLVQILTDINQIAVPDSLSLFHENFYFDLLTETFSIGKVKNGKLIVTFNPITDILKIRFVHSGLSSGATYTTYQAITFSPGYATTDLEFSGSIGSEIGQEEEEEEEEWLYLTSTSIASNNSNPSKVEYGDQVTLTYTASAPINSGTMAVSIAGQAANITTLNGNSFSASIIYAGGYFIGYMPFSIDYQQVDGNPAETVTETTDDSTVSGYNP